MLLLNEKQLRARADHVVCDLILQCARLGELHHALDGHLMTTERVTELGEHVRAGRSVRNDDDEVTAVDLTGVGVQDAAIAAYALART